MDLNMPFWDLSDGPAKFLPPVAAATGGPGDKPTARNQSEKEPPCDDQSEEDNHVVEQVVRWRSRALHLERELGEMRVKYEAEQIKTISLARAAEAHMSASESIQTAQAVDCQDPLVSTSTTPVEPSVNANPNAKSRKPSGSSSASVPVLAAGKNSGATTAAGKKKAAKKKQALAMNSSSKEPNRRNLSNSNTRPDLQTLLDEHFNVNVPGTRSSDTISTKQTDANLQLHYLASSSSSPSSSVNNTNPSIFVAFSSFEQLASAFPKHSSLGEGSLLLSTSIRALQAVSESMKNCLFEGNGLESGTEVPTRDPSSQSTRSSVTQSGSTSQSGTRAPSTLRTPAGGNTQTIRLQKLNVLLTHLLTTSIPLLCVPPSAPTLPPNATPQNDQSESASTSRPVTRTESTELPSSSIETSAASFRGYDSEVGTQSHTAKANRYNKIDSELPSNQLASVAPNPVDVLLDSLTTLVVRPLLHSFVPLSEKFVSSLFGSGSGHDREPRGRSVVPMEPSGSKKYPSASSSSNPNARNTQTRAGDEPSKTSRDSTGTPSSASASSSSTSVYSGLRTEVLRILHDLFLVIHELLGPCGRAPDPADSQWA
ncbi:hypothetical protein AAF712_007339 [Marasmius tenuissimus]|uniref:Uncharacterized protein n=1 Tax=Marasmius tenuissimus TaxID=585030 RepID=A0ABR2ZWG7_9AGAR